MVVTSPCFSSYCPCWISGTGWLQLSFALNFVLRRVSVRNPLVRFACRWLCCSLACRSLCSCLACCWRRSCLARCWLCSCTCCLCSSRFFSPLLQIFDVLLVVIALLLLHLLFFFAGSVAVVLSRIFTTCSLAVVPFVLLLQSHFCGRLRLRGTFLASLQHHYSALRPS